MNKSDQPVRVLAAWFYVIAGSAMLLSGRIAQISTGILDRAGNWIHHLPAVASAEFVGRMAHSPLTSDWFSKLGSAGNFREAATVSFVLALYLLCD